MSNRNRLTGLIVIAGIVKIISSASVELGNDEVYYLSYARHLQWNYFDHPPMVALLIKLSTCNLNFTNDFFVRLGAVLLSSLNTYLVYGITKKIKNEQAAFISALLFTASPYCSVIAGTFIMPDSPQLFFWIAATGLLADIVTEKTGSVKLKFLLVAFGLVSGLCIMSKIHGVFLWVGFGLYILSCQRSLLKETSLYVSIFICLLIISPIIIWNIRNDFITYTFHSARVAIPGHTSIHPDSFLRELLGSILYNNPFSYFLFITVLISSAVYKPFMATPLKRLLLWLSLPLVLTLLLISLFRDTLPHWSGPAFTGLIIISACWLSDQIDTGNKSGKMFYRGAYISVVFLLVINLAGVVFINHFPGTLGKKKYAALGSGDFTLDMYGWRSFAKQFKTMYDSNRASGNTVTTFVISNKWFPGAHIDNYIAQPLQLNFLAIGNLNDIHTYAWLNKYRRQLQVGEDAYYITASDNFCDPAQKYNGIFGQIGKPYIIKQVRGNKPVRFFFIYILKNYSGKQIDQ